MDLQSIIVWIIVGAIAGIIADFLIRGISLGSNRKNHCRDHWCIPWRLDIFTYWGYHWGPDSWLR